MKTKFCSTVLSVLLSYFVIGTMAAQAFQANVIRNHAFDGGGNSWWFSDFAGGSFGSYGRSGAPGAQIRQTIVGYPAVWLQQIVFLPDTIDSLVFELDFSYMVSNAVSPGAQMEAGLYDADTSQRYVTLLESGWFVPQDRQWTTYVTNIPPSDLAALNQARTQGRRIFFAAGHMTIEQQQFHTPAALDLHIDHIRLDAGGTQAAISSTGAVAFLRYDTTNTAVHVAWRYPSNNTAVVVWTNLNPLTQSIKGVAWSPDATELAFSSDHEAFYSIFNSDIYGIAPNATGYRRISNPPDAAALQSAASKGSVTGQIVNNHGAVDAAQVYVEGAASPVIVSLGSLHQTTHFVISNVVDYGLGVLQNVQIRWSDFSNPNARRNIGTVDVVAGGQASAGTMSFPGGAVNFTISDVFWSYDGAYAGGPSSVAWTFGPCLFGEGRLRWHGRLVRASSERAACLRRRLLQETRRWSTVLREDFSTTKGTELGRIAVLSLFLNEPGTGN